MRKRRRRLGGGAIDSAAPGSQRGDSAAPENSSWRSVFGLRDAAKAATKAGDEGGESLLRGGER